MTMIVAIALGVATPSPEAAQAFPAEPALLPSLPYISELSKSGLTSEMFDRPVKAKANLVSLFSTEDYPLESIRNREAGTVAVVLRVGRDGRLVDCVIEQSSGYPALDSQTCRVLWLRARFVPARNKDGVPVESAWRQRIRWELPEPKPTPFKPWSIRIALEFIKGGGVLACNVESSGAIDASQ
ncbi:MAG TPA: energy transducer TonB, partial [Sphingomicrobium sp.]|nr:energy transducer TonB [Sphingomicrobium sp.]